MKIYVDAAAVARLRGGPAGAHLDAFVSWLLEQGYRNDTIQAYVRATVRFMRWTQRAGLRLEALGQESLKNYRARAFTVGKGTSGSYYSGARRFVAFLRASGVLLENITEMGEGPRAFRHWLLHDRGLKQTTCDGYCRLVSKFINALGKDPHSYAAADIRDFIVDQARQSSPARASAVVSATRNYLRFLISRGECRIGLDDAVPRVAAWRLASLPKHLEPADVDRVIAACDPSTSIGVRDRAVVLLLARLGLRAGDVASLRLKDVDWQKGKLQVSGKARQECWLPLPQDAGDAVHAYIEAARPENRVEPIFLNVTPPHRPITSHSVSCIAGRAIQRAGVEAPSHGAHVFRHSAATAMLRKGMSLRDIGTVLRHDSVESTAWYAKVDIELLKTVAQPWPGRPSC